MQTEGTSLSEESALQLWRGLQRGEERALHGLYHLFRDDLYHYARRIIFREELAVNAIQDVFVALWNSRHSLGEARSVKAYLLSMLRRLLMQEIRRRQKYHQWSEAYAERPAFAAFSPEDIVLLDEGARLKKEFVAHLLNTLTAKQREIVYLRYYEELSLQEIADLLDIHYQSVINHLQRAFVKVRSQTTPEQLATLLSAAGIMAFLLSVG